MGVPLYKDYKIEIKKKYTNPNLNRLRIITKYINGKNIYYEKEKGFLFSNFVAAYLSLPKSARKWPTLSPLDAAAAGPDHGRWAFSSCLG